MDDAHVTTVATVLEVLLLAINAGLFAYYLRETHKMRRAAERQVEASLRQVEASFRPAVIVRNLVSTSEHPKLENVGAGPAMQLRWTLQGSEFTDEFSFLRPGEAQYLTCDPKAVFQAAAAGNGPTALSAVIECTYRSLSGLRYCSVSTVDLSTFRVVTTFSDPESTLSPI